MSIRPQELAASIQIDLLILSKQSVFPATEPTSLHLAVPYLAVRPSLCKSNTTEPVS